MAVGWVNPDSWYIISYRILEGAEAVRPGEGNSEEAP